LEARAEAAQGFAACSLEVFGSDHPVLKVATVEDWQGLAERIAAFEYLQDAVRFESSGQARPELVEVAEKAWVSVTSAFVRSVSCKPHMWQNVSSTFLILYIGGI
jgi:hypothetical protein